MTEAPWTPVGDLDRAREVAAELAQRLSSGAILRLTGPMGAGKTTFTRFLVAELGLPASASSPTYALHHRYEHASSADENARFLAVDHWDLFRVRDESELDAAGFWELLDEPGTLTLIEWPDLVPVKFLPRSRDIWDLEFQREGQTGRAVKITRLR